MSKNVLSPKNLYIFFAIELVLAGIIMMLDVLTGIGLIALGSAAIGLLYMYNNKSEKLPKFITRLLDKLFDEEIEKPQINGQLTAVEVEKRSEAINRIIVLTDNLRTEAYDESQSEDEISKIKELLGWVESDNNFFFSLTAYSETVRHIREGRAYIRHNFPSNLISQPILQTGLISLLNRTSSNLINAIKGNNVDLKWALEPQKQIGVNVLQFQNIEFQRIFKSESPAHQLPQSIE